MCKNRIPSILLQKETSTPSSQILNVKKKTGKNFDFLAKNEAKKFINSYIDR